MLNVVSSLEVDIPNGIRQPGIGQILLWFPLVLLFESDGENISDNQLKHLV